PGCGDRRGAGQDLVPLGHEAGGLEHEECPNHHDDDREQPDIVHAATPRFCTRVVSCSSAARTLLVGVSGASSELSASVSTAETGVGVRRAAAVILAIRCISALPALTWLA